MIGRSLDDSDIGVVYEDKNMKRSLTADRHDSPDQDLPDEFDSTIQDEVVGEIVATIIETAAILWAFDFFDED